MHLESLFGNFPFGIYKAMKLRDRVGELIENEKIKQLQIEANEIFNKDKYFGGGSANLFLCLNPQ